MIISVPAGRALLAGCVDGLLAGFAEAEQCKAFAGVIVGLVEGLSWPARTLWAGARHALAAWAQRGALALGRKLRRRLAETYGREAVTSRVRLWPARGTLLARCVDGFFAVRAKTQLREAVAGLVRRLRQGVARPARVVALARDRVTRGAELGAVAHGRKLGHGERRGGGGGDGGGRGGEPKGDGEADGGHCCHL